MITKHLQSLVIRLVHYGVIQFESLEQIQIGSYVIYCKKCMRFHFLYISLNEGIVLIYFVKYYKCSFIYKKVLMQRCYEDIDTKQENNDVQVFLGCYAMFTSKYLPTFWMICFIPEMKSPRSFKMSLTTDWLTQHNILEDLILSYIIMETSNVAGC